MKELSALEERELFLDYEKTRDEETRNTILEKYLFIAEIVAKKFVGRGVEYDDLYQVASLALVKAIERFDISKNVRFSSFVTPSLVGEIKNYFRDKTRMVHISRKDSEDLVKLQEAKRVLVGSGSQPRPEDIAKAMGIGVDRVLELLEIQKAGNVSSMDMTVGDDENISVGELIGDEERGYENIENRDLLKRMLGSLSDEERYIVIARFWRDESQKTVSEHLGTSQMYVSRKERKIMDKLRTFVGENR